jgi:ketosteroid isomerase-like protein
MAGDHPTEREAHARLLAENTELIMGRPVIEQFWRAAIGRARVAGAVRTIGLDDVISSGSLGYTLGTVTVRIPEGPTLVTKYAVIWQRDPDGRWRIAVDSSSPNPREG